MDLTKGSIWQLLRKVTIPASTGSLFQTFYNLVDTYFAGRIYPEALAAIAKSWPIYFIAIAVAVGIGAGTTALISNAIGAKEDRKASKYVAIRMFCIKYERIKYKIYIFQAQRIPTNKIFTTIL